MLGATATWLMVGGLAASAALGSLDKKVSKELADLYRADQEDQQRWDELGDAEASRRQEVRRARALEIVSQGLLDKPVDYYHAAMLFQHGTETDDFLLAHVLSTAAACDGEAQAFFLSAATLDRYLLARDQPQRMGSQTFDEAGKDLGDRSKLLSEAFVQVFRRGPPYERSGLTGRPLDAEARSKKNLQAAQKELQKLAKSLPRSGETGTDASAAKSGEEPAVLVARAVEIANLGQLERAEDFYCAALVLQHGQGVDERVLAHVACTAAGLLGEADARALFQQTLDGLQRALGQAPVFAARAEGETGPLRVLDLPDNVRARFSSKARKR